MKSKYCVFNIADGCVYEGNSLKLAIRHAEDNMSKPYVHSANGKRPVFYGQIGEFNQSYDNFIRQIDPSINSIDQ